LDFIGRFQPDSDHVAKFRGDRLTGQGTGCLKKEELDGEGRARREAARRRKSEWKVNVAIPNSSRSNGSWQITPKTVWLSVV